MERDRWNHSNRVGCGLAFDCIVSYRTPEDGCQLTPIAYYNYRHEHRLIRSPIRRWYHSASSGPVGRMWFQLGC